MNEADELETRWPRVLGRLVLWSIFAVVLYFLSFGPVFAFVSLRWPAVDRGLSQAYAPVLWLERHRHLPAGVFSYHVWWRGLPGGVYQRSRRHPERLIWKFQDPKYKTQGLKPASPDDLRRQNERWQRDYERWRREDASANL